MRVLLTLNFNLGSQYYLWLINFQAEELSFLNYFHLLKINAKKHKENF